MNRWMGSIRTNLLAFLVIISMGWRVNGQLMAQSEPARRKTNIVIHGGAGTILRANMAADLEKQYREKLTEALMAGDSALQHGGSSLDAVEVSIRILEDSPLFNAGKGAVFTH